MIRCVDDCRNDFNSFACTDCLQPSEKYSADACRECMAVYLIFEEAESGKQLYYCMCFIE